MKRVLLFGCALMMAMSGFAQTKNKVVVKPGDTVNVVCEEEPTISKDYKVTKDGLILLGFVGAQQVAGLSEDMAAAKISSALLFHRILDRATVRLKVGGAPDEAIVWSGAVTRSGEIPLRQGLRLSDVVAVARPTESADLEKVKIATPTGQEIVVSFADYNGSNLKYNPELRGGDRVFFPKFSASPDVLVTGMVGAPGAMKFVKGMTLAKALESAGGLKETADAEAIRIEHQGGGADVVALSQAGSTKLQAGDAIKVSEQSTLSYVLVQGAVWKPGRILFKPGMSLTDALNKAGGVLSTAKMKEIRVTRTADRRRRTTKVNMLEIEQGLSGDFALKADDIIEVLNGR